ncbi:hypothetical protein CMMCAS03_00620 [Clavibacter michiganensis subsp. michiganensis]|nr:hypothetical protein CMMCAS04_14710 [Clavibacter michiganensis subsp. michiganensis]OUD96428.1 hypothetical protein CMMCAS03_00620 [Clavibacter michiganensis subsp. michiganensis]
MVGTLGRLSAVHIGSCVSSSRTPMIRVPSQVAAPSDPTTVFG